MSTPLAGFGPKSMLVRVDIATTEQYAAMLDAASWNTRTPT
jgi:hypothetical protein